jgi:hypothetical protein
MSNPVFNGSIPESGITTIPWTDVFSDFCLQIEPKILLACMLILTVFTIRMIVLPRAKLGFFTDEDFLLYPDSIKKLISDIFYYADSLLETLGLGSAIFLVYLAYVQGLFSTGVWVWVWILVGFSALAGFGELVYYIRRKKRLKTKENKEIASKNQEAYEGSERDKWELLKK